jgi:hypothetical protein
VAKGTDRNLAAINYPIGLAIGGGAFMIVIGVIIGVEAFIIDQGGYSGGDSILLRINYRHHLGIP